MDFAPFDRRRYPTLPVREGYREWSETYEDVVQDEMDLRLLARIRTVDWATAGRALDLACGTGRIGAWLRAQGVQRLDGLDFTPEMLARAETKRVYDRLITADMLATGLPAASYDLVLEVLADEHLEELLPLYREAARLAAPAGVFVLVGGPAEGADPGRDRARRVRLALHLRRRRAVLGRRSAASGRSVAEAKWLVTERHQEAASAAERLDPLSQGRGPEPASDPTPLHRRRHRRDHTP